MAGIAQFFINIWNKVQEVLLIILGVLAFLFFFLWRSKTDQVAQLKAQISLIKTQDEADAIQAQINQLLTDSNNAGSKADQLEELAKELDAKRVELQKGSR